MPNVICIKNLNGVDTLVNITTPSSGSQGAYVLSLVKPGNKFWWFQSVPYQVTSCDFTDAPTCANNFYANNLLIAAITKTPEEVLNV